MTRFQRAISKTNSCLLATFVLGVINMKMWVEVSIPFFYKILINLLCFGLVCSFSLADQIIGNLELEVEKETCKRLFR